MILETDIIADLHTHTVFSKHAYSSVAENLATAEKRGIKYMAVTDHFYQPNDPIDRKNELIRMAYMAATCNCSSDPGKPIILNGGEFNLCQQLASDADRKKLYNRIKWRPMWLHNFFIKPSQLIIRQIPELFETAINSSEQVTPTAFAHIERELYRCQNANGDTIKEALADIVDIACSNNMYLEVNESSIIQDEAGGIERMKFWIPYALSKGAMFCMGTDSHFHERVGNFKNSLEIINQFGIPPERILNHKINEEILKAKFCD